MKKILTYLFFAVFTVCGANFYYEYSGNYEADIRKCDAGLLSVFDSLAAKSDLIYFGESSNTAYKDSDSSHASISDLIAVLEPEFKLGAVTKGGIHAEVFRVLLARLEGSSPVKQIIVTVNLRSFGINWMESDLETNLSRANVLYANYPPILKKFMLSFKAYDNKDSVLRVRVIKWHYKYDVLFSEEGKYKTVKKWDAFMFDKGHMNADGTRNAEKCALACHFIKNYAFVINENNPRVEDMDEIVEYCEKNKIKLVLNLLPENVDRAKELCGDDLIFLMQQNVSFLQKRYGGRTSFVNNLDLLPDSCFIDREWPTEHYDFYGRNKVAQRLAEAL